MANIWPLLLFFIALIGPFLASFFSVMVMRREGLTKASAAGSQCDHCGARLKWYELIPLVSFVFLRGKCRHCHKRLDARMVWAELLGGLTSVLIAVALWRLYPDYDENYLSALFGLIVHAAIAGALLYLSVYDIFTLSIPTRATLYTTLAAVVANVAALAFGYVLPGFTSGLGELDNLLAGVVAGGLIWVIIIITKQRGMGLGDIYIALLIGLLLGWPGIVTAFYVMLLSATGFGLLWALYIGKFKGLQVPLVPFMTLGYLVGLGWGVGVFDFLFFGI